MRSLYQNVLRERSNDINLSWQTNMSLECLTGRHTLIIRHQWGILWVTGVPRESVYSVKVMSCVGFQGEWLGQAGQAWLTLLLPLMKLLIWWTFTCSCPKTWGVCPFWASNGYWWRFMGLFLGETVTHFVFQICTSSSKPEHCYHCLLSGFPIITLSAICFHCLILFIASMSFLACLVDGDLAFPP